jgi:hypothetical protein
MSTSRTTSASLKMPAFALTPTPLATRAFTPALCEARVPSGVTPVGRCKTLRPHLRACSASEGAALAASTGADAGAAADSDFSRFAVGDAVRVTKSVIMYHMPGARNEPIDVAGKTGTVSRIISTVDNMRITATKPVVIKFDGMKTSGHFDDEELEPA